MLNLRVIVPLYLASKTNSWAPTTLRSETARLTQLVETCSGKTLQEQWTTLCSVYGPYSRVTAWTRLAALTKWALERGYAVGTNEYVRFREDNARLFKNAYSRRHASLGFQELRAAVAARPDDVIRAKLMQMLENGLRYAESRTHKDGYVVGKGDKARATIHRDGPVQHASYAAIRAACKGLGIKPHDLRKAFATELYRKGLREVEICEVMGWSSFDTARSYVRPEEFETIRRRIVA